jgi:hypothetical protein
MSEKDYIKEINKGGNILKGVRSEIKKEKSDQLGKKRKKKQIKKEKLKLLNPKPLDVT